VDWPESDEVDDEPPPTTVEKIRSIEKLLIGPASEEFRKLEQQISVFCPFEAIGMVRQEIRHAHFLSYILDPHRPHGIQDIFLKAFLHEVVLQAQEGQVSLQPLEIHCSDYSQALVYRERADIDLLVEVPANSMGSGKKGMVVAIELKVDASESKHQLEKYRSHVRTEYPEKDWDHIFAFLTLDAKLPSEANMEFWVPISLLDLVLSFDLLVAERKLVGESVDLYKKYSAMIRRNLMDDEKLAELAKQIWAKHKSALEVLYDYWPDLQADIFEWLSENSNQLVDAVKETTGFTLVPDTSSPRLLRYSVQEWKQIEGFCGDNMEWVKSGSLMLFELTDWGDGRIRFSFVLGPGDLDIRTEIYQKVLDLVDAGELKIGRKTAKIGKFKHFSAVDVQTSKAYEKAEVGEENAKEMGEKVIKRVTAFLKETISVYDKILREVMEK